MRHHGGVMRDLVGRSALMRLVVVVLLAVGMVGMHHLVVAACHHVGAASSGLHGDAHGSGVSATGDVGVPLGTTTSTPMPFDEAPEGLLGAAAMCLAILLAVALALPGLLGRARRLRLAALRPRGRPLMARIPAPPDLTLLSVCRT